MSYLLFFLSTTNVTIQNQQPATSMTNTPSPHNNSHADRKGKRKLDDTDIDSNSNAMASVYQNFKDVKQIKHFIREIVIHDRTTIEVQSDGSCIVRPHPLQLPNEIITLIFSHLTTPQLRKTIYQCTLVTKQFHTIANPLLWESASFSNYIRKKQFMDYLSNASEQRLAILGQHIRKLSVDVHSMMDTSLQRLVPHLSDLTHISFVGFNYIDDTDFQQVVSHCRRLTSIQLENTQLTQASFSAISKYCPQLQHLEWRLTKRQSFDWLECLVQSCPLTSLELRSDIFRHRSALTPHAMTIIQQFDRLTSLTFDFPFGIFDILDVVYLATQVSPENSNNETTTTTTPLWWPHLTSLKLTACKQIDNTMWINFINARPRLQQLYLSHTRQLNNTTFNAIATRLPELTRFTLLGDNRITTDEIRQFIRNCGTLERLVMDRWPLISKKDFPGFDLNIPTDDDDTEDDIPPVVFNRKHIDMIRQNDN